jgi:hypothetical protein
MLDFCVLRYACFGRPDSPPNVGLLKTLQRIMPWAPRLVDITALLRQSTEQSTSLLKELAYDQWLAKDMEGLALSRAP